MWGTSEQFLSFRTKMYILEMISGTAFGRLLHCKGPVKQAIFMVYWTKKRRVHLWRLGFYSNSPKWFLSEQATLARQYLTLFMMFLQCSPVLSLSLPSKLSASPCHIWPSPDHYRGCSWPWTAMESGRRQVYCRGTLSSLSNSAEPYENLWCLTATALLWLVL